MAYGTVYVQAEVDVRDVFKECDDDDFEDELKRRGLMPDEDLNEALRDAPAQDYPTIVERMLFPKWSSSVACLRHYNKEMGR
ncbi:hypothetical protein [Bosea sp. LjRoot237]|uniref:hypothetical protein n=1 Tax=Bosea sp. LjRoot237 TaxID=3342292 RepID=UPI003ECE2444